MVPVLLAELRHYLEQMPSFEITLKLYKYISVVLKSLRPYCLGWEHAFIIVRVILDIGSFLMVFHCSGSWSRLHYSMI